MILIQKFAASLFVILLSLCGCSLLSLSSAAAAKNGDIIRLENPEKRYQEAKFYYNELQNSTPGQTTRRQWQHGARNFRTIYFSHPKSKLAAPCLYMLARLNRDMYNNFQQPEDLEQSIRYYKDIPRLFPGSSLADDAYYALSDIALGQQHSPHSSAAYLRQIVERYPNGDMRQRAEKKLKILSKEHNIALPEIMMTPSSQGTRLNYILPLRYWSSEDYARIIIFASNPVNYRETRLPRANGEPDRLVVEFRNSYIEPKNRKTVPIENGLLTQVYSGQYSEDSVRIILDMTTIASYRIFNLPDPFRIIIDVRGKTDSQDLAESKKGKLTAIANPEIRLKDEQAIPLKIDNRKHKNLLIKTTNSEQKSVVLTPARKKILYRHIGNSKKSGQHDSLSLARQLGLGVRTIVIDPGHGGKDPGATGHGIKEKDVVLKLAKQLAPILKKELDCEVILTREEDVYIPLEERTAIANTKGADLFLSLHVNAHPAENIRGMETYYLNLATNAEAMRVAAMENATSTHQMSDLQNILADILKNSKINESAKLAENVQQAIVKTGENESKYTRIKNLGVKQAPFYVLIGAEMPAILIEAAFISNKDDAQNLREQDFLQKLAKQIATGVKAYTSEL
ncbi:MAG: hypothetical protein CSA20_05995 [Deltaproteobacteria bacterium]|nr:MAG: hypothetical protein CSA20_05995 [Deltaproteobacteria bacterium]